MSSLPWDIKLLVGAGLLISALTGCGPGIDPVTQTDVARRVALLGQSPLEVTAPTESQPHPFAVGQWTQHRVIDVRGVPSLLTAKIVAKDGESFWFETVLESEVGKLITKLLVYVGDRADPSSIRVLAGKIRFRSGSIVDIPSSKAASYAALFHIVVSWQGQPQEDAVVPAGTFRACFKGKNVWERWVTGPSSLAWSHPAVPISGLVRAEPIEDEQPWYRKRRQPIARSTELVGFGETGAASELP